MSHTVDPKALLVLLTPTSTFDERKAAVLAIAIEGHNRGWADCDKAYQDVLLLANLDIPPPKNPLEN